MWIKFSNLEVGDIVYCVYNKNYNNEKEYDLSIITAKILENRYEERIISYTSYYEDDTRLFKEWNFVIQPKNINEQYRRYYDDFYNDKCQMTMCSGVWSSNPSLEVFVNKEDAKNYAIKFMQDILKRNLDQINKLQLYNNHIEKTLKKLSEYE